MKLPDIRKILREDIKSKEAWVNSLITPINMFMDTIYIAMNKNVTFHENIRCIVKELSINTPSTYPVMPAIEFQNTLGSKAVGLWVVQAYRKSDYLPVMSPVYAPWIDDNGVIKISGLTGLAPSESYLVRFVVI